MNPNNIPGRLTAMEVLRCYEDEDLPAFIEIVLEDVNQVGNFGDQPLQGASLMEKKEFGNTPTDIVELANRCDIVGLFQDWTHGQSLPRRISPA